MKAILVHGDNSVKVTERINKFIDVAKSRGWKISRVDKDSSMGLPELLTSPGLFSEEHLYLINAKSISSTDVRWINKNPKKLSGNVIFYNDSFLSQKAISSLPKMDKIEEYNLPQTIFKFLDSFYPGNPRSALRALKSVMENKSNTPEFVYALLARHLRDLYIAEKSINLLDYPMWRKRKLLVQSKKFENNKLKKIIKALALADYESKTSNKEPVYLLDLIISTKLE